MGRPKIPYCNEFSAQKQNARRRGIEFNFTYDTWIEWWGEDIVNRGKGRDKLVMARNNDCGPYAVDNVKKLTNKINVSEGNTKKVYTAEYRQKLSEASKKRWEREKGN